MDLDGGVIHNEVRLKGWAQKSLDFRAHPFKRPEKWISAHPNPYVQPHTNNRYISNFMDKRQEISGSKSHRIRIGNTGACKMLRISNTVTVFTGSDVQVVKCSACVVRDWGKETPAHDVLQVLIFFLLQK
jgi:hypothetical protein